MKWRLAEAYLGLVPEKILIQEFNQEKIGANVLRIARFYRKTKGRTAKHLRHNQLQMQLL